MRAHAHAHIYACMHIYDTSMHACTSITHLCMHMHAHAQIDRCIKARMHKPKYARAARKAPLRLSDFLQTAPGVSACSGIKTREQGYLLADDPFLRLGAHGHELLLLHGRVAGTEPGEEHARRRRQAAQVRRGVAAQRHSQHSARGQTHLRGASQLVHGRASNRLGRRRRALRYRQGAVKAGFRVNASSPRFNAPRWERLAGTRQDR